MVQIAKSNRKYRLHQKLTKAGIKYNPHLKTIYLPYDFEMGNKDLKELQNNYCYQIQLEI